ncbi:MAG: hypothetical protein QXT58_00680 [Archaeoglobaceae archaeon]
MKGINALMVILFCSLSFGQRVSDVVNSFCQKVKLPSFKPVRSINLKSLSDFSTVALGFELESEKGLKAWAITSRDGNEVYEFGFGEPFWRRWEKVLRERVIFKFGQFLSDGEWHFLYRGLLGYGVAVKKGMTIRVEGRSVENWGDGREDGVWALFKKVSTSSRDGNIVLANFNFPLLPTLRSTHATSLAMWAIGEGIVSSKEPYQAVIGSIHGLITRCLCDLPDKPFVHEIERGLPSFLKLRGKVGRVQTFLLSETPWAKIRENFLGGKVAFVSSLFRKDQKQKEMALYRIDGITSLALGFWESKYGVYLIVLSPQNILEKPKEVKGWLDGVSLINVDGPSVNLVFSFPILEGGRDGGAKGAKTR